MSNPNPPELIREFARRTRVNLELIEQAAQVGKDKAYEVTQLINSMIGLLLLPEERLFKNIPKTTLAELERKGWPTVRPDIGKSPNLRSLVVRLRHAFALAHFEYWPDSKNEIEQVRVWDIKPRTKRKVWQATLTVQDLRTFALSFGAMIESGDIK